MLSWVEHENCFIISGQGLQIRDQIEKYFFLFLNQNIYVVETQKNHLIELLLLSTQNTQLNW